MRSIQVSGLTKAFGDEPPVLAQCDLEIAAGEFLAVAGPSGSGKTTLLRLIAGLEKPTSGRVAIDGTDVTDLDPQRRNLAMVFQNFGLYAHRSALRNITFPLEVSGVTPETARTRRAVDEARHFHVEHLLGKTPGQLSAGHRQAVATARSIVKKAGVVLMDEPLAHLDAKARVRGRVELQRLHREIGATIVYVTNDQVEAMSLGDRIAVLDEGRLQQVDSPRRVYEYPANTMVAGFIGVPPMSFVPGELVDAGGAVDLLVGTDRLRFADLPAPAWRDRIGFPVVVGIRPHHLSEPPEGTPFERCLHGRIAALEDHGDDVFATVLLGVADASVTARLRPGTPQRVGDGVELAVAIDRLRLFDPADGRAV